MTIEFVNEPSGLSESTLGALKEEVLHARTNFPNQDRQTSMLALTEEVGELAQAIMVDLKRLNSALNSQDLWIGEVPRIARKAKLKRIAERRERSRLLDC